MDKRQSASERKEEIRQLLQEWEKSGLTKKVFCAQKQIKYQTFIGWIVQQRDRAKSGTNGFVPVQIETHNHQGIFAEINLSATKKIILHQPVSAEVFQAILKC